MLNKQDVKKIGVLRANALGDFILTIPAIEALKQGRKGHQEFLKNRGTAIDRIIPIPESGHNKSLIASIAPDNVLQASWELLNMIKEDLLYDCHN